MSRHIVAKPDNSYCLGSHGWMVGNSDTFAVQDRGRYCPCLWLIFFILGFTVFGHAQTSATGAVTGIVLDPSGAVVPSVSIQISNESAGITQSTSSNEYGWFVIQLLPPGTYQLQASRSDFKTLVVS